MYYSYMKKIFTIFLFFTLYSVYPQLYINGEAHYNMSVKGKVGFTRSPCGNNITGGLQHIVGIYEKGYPTPFVFAQGNSPYPNIGHGLKGVPFGDEVTFKESNKILKIDIITTSRGETFLGFCKEEDNENKSVKIEKYCFWGVYDFYKLGLNQPGWFNLYIYPVVNLSFRDSRSDILGDDDYLIIPEIDGINKDFYQWQYDIGEGWKNFDTKYQKKNSLKIKGKDFIPSNKINQNVAIRVDMGCKLSNEIQFTYRKSLPHIINQSISKTSCYDSEDCKITLFFDRDLEEYENMSFSITDIDNHPIPNNYKNITQLQNNKSYTIENLPAGNYKLKLIGKYKGNPSYSPHSDQFYYFTIQKSNPVNFSFSQTDVYCKGGEDGSIVLSAFGGTENGFEYELNNNNQWIAFPNNDHSTIIKNLKKGTYVVNVRDRNKCVAKIQRYAGGKIVLGDIKNTHITISEPEKPLTITYTEKINPKFNGASNGKIVVKIEGGTLYYDNSYDFEILKDGTQPIMHLATTEFVNNAFYIILENIPKGIYNFTIYDKNYSLATNKEGCSIENSYIELTEPQPLKASIELSNPISCNSQNEFGDEKDKNPYDGQRDESQDGELKIEASGGTPFTGTQNGGKPYIYTWKKQDSNGYWVTLPIEDDTAKNLSAGKYAINIQDANGIVLGEYNTHTVTKVVDVIYELKEPAKLTLTLQKTDATCRGNDGKITAIPAGGTPPYTYLWNTGHSGAHITGLSAGKYFVTVSDSRGCSVQEKVVLSYPEEVEVNNAIITPVTCYEGNDGKIALTLSGGKGNINVSWYDAQGNLLSQRITNGGKTINGLKAGKYKAVFRDQSDCPALEQFYEVLQPEKTVINIPSQITICQGDSRSFDLSTAFPSATFRWTDSTGTLLSTEPTFAVSAKGIYKVEITDQKGCREATTFEVLQSDKVLEVDFLAATNAYYNYTVKLINLSHSITTQWVLPQEVTLIKEENGGAEVRFPKEGTYTIGLKGFLDGCEKTIYKTLWVEKDRLGIGKENSFKEVVIDDFKIVDNPNNGTFRIEVKLKKPAAIKIYGMDILGQMVISPIEQPESTTFNIPV